MSYWDDRPPTNAKTNVQEITVNPDTVADVATTATSAASSSATKWIIIAIVVVVVLVAVSAAVILPVVFLVVLKQTTTTAAPSTGCSSLFLTQTTYTAGTGPIAVAIADLNSDSKSDIAIANFASYTMGVFPNAGTGTFLSQMTYSAGGSYTPGGIAVGDVTLDGKPDIVISNLNANNFGYYANTGGGAFNTIWTLSTGGGTSPRGIAVGDVSSDSKPDIIVAYTSINYIGVWLNTGSSPFFSAQAQYAVGATPYYLALGDVNADSKLDIITVNSASNSITVFLNGGTGTFTPLSPVAFTGGGTPYGIAVSDLNSDNRADVVVASGTMNNIIVFINTGCGTSFAQTTYSTGTSSLPFGVAIGDVNSDSLVDVVVANYGANNVGVFLNGGNGTLGTQTTYSTGTGSSPYGVAIGDINSDGKADIVATNNAGNSISVLSRC